MNFKKQPFGFMDMLRFKKMVPTRRKMLAEGENKPLPQEYRTNTLAHKLHPGYMQVELTAARPLTDTIRELTFKRVDEEAFPFFRAGQYVSLQVNIGGSLVSRPYSIVPPPGRPWKTSWCWRWRRRALCPDISTSRPRWATGSS